MKIAVFALRKLNNSRDLPRFLEAGKKLGIELIFYQPKDVHIKIEDGAVSLLDRHNSVLNIDGAINWIPYSKYDELWYAIDQMKIPYINNIEATRNCRNKVLTNILLSKADLTQPKSEYYFNLEKYESNSQINFPSIYKRKSGTHGIGAKKFNNSKDFVSFIKRKTRMPIYLQEFVENFGYDYRIVVVGGKVIGGLKKTNNGIEWRTHALHGGSVESYKPSKAMKKLCLLIAKTMKIDFSGIDVMPSVDKENYVLEVNSVPGMTLFYRATGINMAEEILKNMQKVIKDGY